MKLIKCIIQPHKLDEVMKGLQNIVTGMTVSEVRGFGHQKGQLLLYRGREYDVSLLPKAMIEIVTDDNKVDDVVRLVIEKARTGQIGDGRIFVLSTEENYHVRTGFMDRD
ncbi:MAG TPA: P-II family nitrogen regulator [Terriglobia bacterium]|nr:P-II family nitrogen regulator [Terriglobia bacterium]